MRRSLLPVLLLLLLPAVAGAKAKKSDRVEDLMNPLLSPEHALWLVGPISRLATAEEVERFTRLAGDEEAVAFIDEFWRKRNPDPRFTGNALRERFEERLPEADKLYTEAGVPGRRSDRGTLFVLYGAPAKERYDIAEHPDDPPVLVWEYPPDAPKGLDGKRPERTYRFIKRGEVTLFYTPNLRPARPRFDRPGFGHPG